MKAVDTNVILRFLMDDDPAHSPIATEIMRGDVFVPSTVILEVVWVLGSRYRLDRGQIVSLMRALLSSGHVAIDQPVSVRWALSRYEAGADFPDMMHIAMSPDSEAMLTFDTDIARRAGLDSPIPVETIRA